MGVPYITGLSEKLSRTFSFCNPSNMLCQLRCSPKDPTKKKETSGVIYQINCEGISKVSGIGEIGRTPKAMFTEHQLPSTRTPEVSQQLHLQERKKHKCSLDSGRILDHNTHDDMRGIREAVNICMLHSDDLNRDGGHHQHPYN